MFKVSLQNCGISTSDIYILLQLLAAMTQKQLEAHPFLDALTDSNPMNVIIYMYPTFQERKTGKILDLVEMSSCSVTHQGSCSIWHSAAGESPLSLLTQYQADSATIPHDSLMLLADD